ncbi:unnamed protein product, partial [Rotaria sp. Silwood1]
LCFKLNPNNNDQTESVSSVIQSDRSTIHRYSQRPRGQLQRFLSCDHLGDVDRYVCTTRNGLLSPPLPSYNRCHSNKVNLTDVTNTSLSVKSNQRVVPRLSINPKVSNSSITDSVFSTKQ